MKPQYTTPQLESFGLEAEDAFTLSAGGGLEGGTTVTTAPPIDDEGFGPIVKP